MMHQSPSEGVFNHEALPHAAPAVNRDLKPGRRNHMLGQPTQLMEQRQQIIDAPQSSSGSMLPKDLVHHASPLDVHKASRSLSSPRRTNYEDEWYAGACDRADAEHALHLVNKDGAFLVRDGSSSTTSAPFVLAVYYDKKVYNVKIRFIEHKKKYALGTGQMANEMFDTVEDIIKFHSISPIVFINMTTRTTKSAQSCVLTNLVTRHDINKLLL